MEWCIINNILYKFCIPDYVIYGIALIILGILIAVFIPFTIAKKIGFGMVLVGLIMSVLFSLVVHWWTTIPALRYITYGLLFFGLVWTILFYEKSPVKKVRKK